MWMMEGITRKIGKRKDLVKPKTYKRLTLTSYISLVKVKRK